MVTASAMSERRTSYERILAAIFGLTVTLYPESRPSWLLASIALATATRTARN